jgi:YidC/Oxa1 family membrane protein insertase
MFEFFAAVMAWIYDLVPNYTAAIALLTLAIMVPLTPLTLKSTASMMKMQEFQPEMKRLQAKHKGDRQALNEEMMKLYQEHGINPLGGCIPMLIQMPVFIVLYQVVRGLTDVTTNGGGPKYLERDSQLYLDIKNSVDADGNVVMDSFWGLINLARIPRDVVQENLIDSIPYLLLIGVVIIGTIIQQRQMTARTKASGNKTEQPAQMQTLMKIMPFMLPVFSFMMPAGLIIYFITSNWYRIGQQAYIHRTMVKPAAEKRTNKKTDEEDVEPDETAPHPKSRQNQKRKKRK